MSTNYIYVAPFGDSIFVYDESIMDVLSPTNPSILRVSTVEPDDDGKWWADLSEIDGPRIGPFDKRSFALTAEVGWLNHKLLDMLTNELKNLSHTDDLYPLLQ